MARAATRFFGWGRAWRAWGCFFGFFPRWRVGDVHGALGHFFVRALLVFVAVSFAAAPEVFNDTKASLPSRPTHSRAHKWISTFL
jgi:hypothetical protein